MSLPNAAPGESELLNSQQMVELSKRHGRLAVLLLLLVLLLFAFQHTLHPPSAKYLGMHTIEWVVKDGCKAGAAPRNLKAGRGAFGSYKVERANGTFWCESTPLIPASRHIALTAAWGGAENAVSRLQAVGADGRVYAESELVPLLPELEPQWHRTVLTLPGDAPLTGILIRLSGPSDGWATVVSRADYLSAPIPAAETINQRAQFIQQFVFAGLAVILAVLAFYHAPSMSLPRYALLLSVAVLGIHFRNLVYFQWDEWHILQRFSELGLSGVIHTHNEHFLPFFFLFFYLETLLLRDFYQGFILVSVAIHIINALLLTRLLEKIGFDLPHIRSAARILGIIFAVNALHSEALHWAFEQSLLIAQLLTLVSLHALWSWIFNGKRRPLVSGVFAAALAPLFFGNGFNIPLQLAAFALPALLAIKRPRVVLTPQTKRAFSFIVATSIALVIPAMLYYFNRHGSGHNIDEANPFAFPRAVLSYLFVGVGLGTVLRGSGLFPSLAFNAATYARQILESKISIVQNVPFSAEVFFALLGFGLLGVLLLLALSTPPRRWATLCFLTGLGVMISVLFLPALGRWAYGPIQSLSLRYHYASLVGLAVLTLPALRSLLVFSSSVDGRTRPLRQLTVLLLLTGHFYTQLYLAEDFTYFTSRGEINREYIQRLQEWNIRRQLNNSPDFNMSGTMLDGLSPKMPPTLTPGRSADEITRTLHWINPSTYPAIPDKPKH